MEISIHLSEKQRKEIADILANLLAHSYSLFVKTQFFHWNVQGTDFFSYHKMFEEQYEDLFEAIDIIAERIRALGLFPEGSFSAFQKRSIIKEESKIPSAKEMIEKLTQDHETIIGFLRDHLPKVEGYEDGATADMINKRLDVHEKTAWMLRSHLS